MSRVKRIRCLFLVPSLRRAGAETQVVDLVNGLDSSLFEKHLFTFHEILELQDRVDHKNIQLYNYPRRYKFDLTPIKQIAKLIDREKIDIIHCTLQFSLLLAWLARLLSKHKPPLVTAVHTTINRSLKEELQDRLIYRYLLCRCADIFFVCENQHRHWLKKYPVLANNSRVIYNGIDAEKFDPANWMDAGQSLRQKLRIPDNAAVISCIAGFRHEKGHQHLINAFATLDSRTYLVLAGDGEMQTEIESLVNKKGLTGQVRFLGVIDEVRPLLAMSDLTVLASTAVETFSIAMLESMAMAVPMLATDIGGMNEAIIPDKTGFLVLPGNTEQLSTTLSQAMNNCSALKKMGQTARTYVLDHFTKKNMIEKTTQALLSAIKTDRT